MKNEVSYKSYSNSLIIVKGGMFLIHFFDPNI